MYGYKINAGAVPFGGYEGAIIQGLGSKIYLETGMLQEYSYTGTTSTYPPTPVMYVGNGDYGTITPSSNVYMQ
jgi:hypothetical protein